MGKVQKGLRYKDTKDKTNLKDRDNYVDARKRARSGSIHHLYTIESSVITTLQQIAYSPSKAA